MLENYFIGLSLIDINSEASYQKWSIEESEWLNKVIQ